MQFIRENSLENQSVSTISADEVDLKRIYRSLSRNRDLILKLSLTGFVFSGIIAFSTKNTWQGNFQIVLENNSNSPASSFNLSGNLSDLVGLSTSSANTLKTEVEILKSPSVLINVFEFVKKKRELNNPESKSRFRIWKQNLDIELEAQTSVLNISYQDHDKDIILPVLNRISNTYQEYSSSKRLREIELGVEYFKSQVEIYKNKTVESLRKAQQFAIDQDLSVLQGESEIDKDITNILNIEAIRVQAGNEIRYINQQLEKIKDLQGDDEEIIYLASTIPSTVNLSQNLRETRSSLAESRSIYKENDKTIQDLIKERILIIDLLKEQVYGYLIAKKADAEARLKSSERPEGVLIKYKQLLSKSAKDKATLNQLEIKYRAVLLERARVRDPWDLITKPVLSPRPVKPSRKKMLALGLLSGAIVGSGAALLKDKRKDIIYSVDELESLTSWTLLSSLSVNQKQSWDEFFHLIETDSRLEDHGRIALIPVGEIDQLHLKQLSDSFTKFSENSKLIISKDIREISKCKFCIIAAALGISKTEELIQVKKKILLSQKPVLGLLSLCDIDLNSRS